LNKEVPKILRQDKLETLEDLKKNFIEDGLLKKIPMNNLLVFWRNSLDDNLNKLQEKFYREANKRKLKAVDSMWARYKQKLYEV
jgi:ferric iron reductase protein FhuF